MSESRPPPTATQLDASSPDELRARLNDLLERLAALAPGDPARGRLAAERLDVAAARRRATADEDQLAAWSGRSRPHVDNGRPFIRSDSEGGGIG